MNESRSDGCARTGPVRWGVASSDLDVLLARIDGPAGTTPDARLVAATALTEDRQAIAADAAARWMADWPSLEAADIERVRRGAIDDGVEHLEQLANAVATGRPALFADYLEWRASRYEAMDLSPAEEHHYLVTLERTIVDRTAPDVAAVARRTIGHGFHRLSDPRPSSASFLQTDAPLAQIAARYLDALLAGETDDALTLVRRAIDHGADPTELYLDVFQPALHEVGRLWQLGRATVAQEHEVTTATERAMALVATRAEVPVRAGRRAVIGCVGGEQHELGARIVSDLLTLDGWRTHLVGGDCPPQELADLAATRDADLVAVSATLTTHLARASEVVTAVRARTDAPILIGGRPFNLVPDLWRLIGADGTAPDAASALAVADALVEARHG